MDDSRIICDEVIESLDENAKTKSYGGTRSIPTNFNEKKGICKTQTFLYFCHIFINYYIIINNW